MAAAASASSAASPFAVSSIYSRGKQNYVLSSSVTVLKPRSPKFHLYISDSLPGLGRLPVWSGLKHLGISLRRSSKEVKNKRKGGVVYASLFGVGAPEALVIGVVALLVFGPKGLAEVARNLGKTLRAFQPTLRELQDVSREFKSTLECEIGLDEVQSTLQSPYQSTTSVNEKPQTEKPQAVVDQNAVQVHNTPYSSEELLKVTEQQLASAFREKTADTEERPKDAVTDLEASTDSTFSAESGSTAVASDNISTENARQADVPPTTVAVTVDPNASSTATETEAAVSNIPPTDAPIPEQELQTE